MQYVGEPELMSWIMDCKIIRINNELIVRYVVDLPVFTWYLFDVDKREEIYKLVISPFSARPIPDIDDFLRLDVFQEDVNLLIECILDGRLKKPPFIFEITKLCRRSNRLYHSGFDYEFAKECANIKEQCLELLGFGH